LSSQFFLNRYDFCRKKEPLESLGQETRPQNETDICWV